MSNCELTLTFDRPDLTYHFGEVVNGTVDVRVASKYVCRQLALHWQWRTHGRGEQDLGHYETRKLFEGSWEPGWVYRYPFSFTAPNGPATYHGHNLNVDWYVLARADSPEAFDRTVEQEILLVPPATVFPDGIGSHPEQTDQIQVNLGPRYQVPPSQLITKQVTPGAEASRRAAWLLLLAPFPLVFRLITPPFDTGLNPVEMIVGFVGLLVLLESLQVIIGDRMARIGSTRFLYASILGFLSLTILLLLAQYSFVLADVAFGGLLNLVGLYLRFKRRRQRSLGQVTVLIQPVVIKRGTGVGCRVQFKRSETGLQPLAWATLIAREYAFVGSASAGVFIPGPLAYEKTCALAAAPFIGSRDTSILQTVVTVPKDAPLTFSGWSNRLVCEVALRVSAAGVPAWNASYSVIVCP